MGVDAVVAADGYRLPLRSWLPDRAPTAVILGLHGFSDYGNAFATLQDVLVDHRGIAIYAYDQRGFGAAANPGIWPGTETLIQDARTVLSFLRERYPDSPLYLLGESMGAAVALVALSQGKPPTVDGAILLSPAVRGFDAMPWYQELSLWLAMRIMPGKSFTSRIPRKLGIRPTDDPEVMRRLAADPLVQKSARVDALYGLTKLMTAASRVTELTRPASILYSPDDLIIPAESVCVWLRRLIPARGVRIALYPDGYHMLTRYSGSARVVEDIAALLTDPEGRLPSGLERQLEDAKAMVCQH